MTIFKLSLQKGCFPEELKNTQVTTIYKADDVNEIGNYRPISVLPCFSIILERTMYNQLTNKMLRKKQFGFHKGDSTEHAIIQLTDQINNSFEKYHFKLGIFIDLSKAFDTVDHSIVIKPLKLYESYLINRKQYIN